MIDPYDKDCKDYTVGNCVKRYTLSAYDVVLAVYLQLAVLLKIMPNYTIFREPRLRLVTPLSLFGWVTNTFIVQFKAVGNHLPLVYSSSNLPANYQIGSETGILTRTLVVGEPATMTFTLIVASGETSITRDITITTYSTFPTGSIL